MVNARELATMEDSLETAGSRLRELVAHLRQQRAQLREEWARLITEAKLLTAMTKEEIFAEATSVYDNYVEALETGTYEALQAYIRTLIQEQPKLRMKALTGCDVGAVVQELRCPEGEIEIRWSSGIRAVRTIEAFTPDPSHAIFAFSITP